MDLNKTIMELRERGVTQVKIAARLQVTVGMVAGVIRRERNAATTQSKRNTSVVEFKKMPPLPPLPPSQLKLVPPPPRPLPPLPPVKAQPTPLPPQRVEPALVWHAKSIIDLKPDECKFSVATIYTEGGGEQFLFCAEPAVSGRPYCEAHVRDAYTGIPTKMGPRARFLLPRRV
jgi:hypothetical protein